MQKSDTGLLARLRVGVSPLVLAALAAGPVWAGTLDDDVLAGTSGDGLILVDEEEGVVAPGIKAVTFTRTRIEDPENEGEFLFLDPFPVFLTDYSDLTFRGEMTNCLMASNPDVYCDSERGSGKRIKTLLTGPTPLDLILSTTPGTLPGETITLQGEEGPVEVDTSSVDYFTFGKIENFTGARITGFSVELLDMDGTPMGELDAADAVLFNLDTTEIGLGGRLVDGLFGAGGNEGEIGFFTTNTADPESTVNRAGFSNDFTIDVLDFGPGETALLSQADYTVFFGDAFLADNMVPDGLFWDDNDNPDDESALVAWYNVGADQWTYGSLAPDAGIDARLDELAAALGVDALDLAYAPGDPVPDAILERAESNGLFGVDRIEDLRNANLNYTITVGNVEDGQFILRYAPRFAQIVEETRTPYQFSVAGALDSANIPYLGADEGYLTTIDEILAIEDPAEQNTALERLGYSFLGAYGGLGYELARNQVHALGTPAGVGAAGSATVSTQGSPWWQMGESMQGFVSLGGSTGEVSGTSTGGDYDFTTTDVSFGLKTTLADGLDGGLMLGYGRADADIDDSRGSLDAEGFAFGGFIEGPIGAAGNFRAFAGVQNLDFDSERNIDIPGFTGTATGDTDGTVTFAGISADYMAVLGAGYAFGPMGSIEIYNTSVDGFDETGAGIYNLSVEDFDDSFTLARLGARGEAMLGQATLRGHVAYASRNGSDDSVQTAFGNILVGSTPLDGKDDDWLDIGLGVSMPLGGSGSQTSLDAEYRGAFSDDYTSHGARLSLQMRF